MLATEAVKSPTPPALPNASPTPIPMSISQSPVTMVVVRGWVVPGRAVRVRSGSRARDVVEAVRLALEEPDPERVDVLECAGAGPRRHLPLVGEDQVRL